LIDESLQELLNDSLLLVNQLLSHSIKTRKTITTPTQLRFINHSFSDFLSLSLSLMSSKRLERAGLARDKQFNEFMELKKLHPDWSNEMIQLHQQKVKGEKWLKARKSREAREKRKDAEEELAHQRQVEQERKEKEKMKADFLKLNEDRQFNNALVNTSIVNISNKDLLKEYENLNREITNQEFGAAVSNEQLLEEMLLIARYRATKKYQKEGILDEEEETERPGKKIKV